MVPFVFNVKQRPLWVTIIFSADLLNKFLQLTPRVQAFIGLEVCVIILGFFYFFNQAINAVIKPFCIQQDNRLKEKE